MGLLPLSQRKDAVVPCAAGQAAVLLLRLQKRRRRHQLHHGGGESLLPRCGALSRTAREHARAGRRAQRRKPTAVAYSVAQPRRGALLLQSALLAQGRAGARVHAKPQDHAAQRNELRPRRIGGRVGRLIDRDAEKGLWRRRAACLGTCHPRQERRAVRQIPQAPHLPYHRRARRRAGLWRAHHQQGRSGREVYEHARDHRLQQAARFIRAEPGQKEQAQQHYFGRGQHRRRDAASGGIRQCLRLDGHSADDGAAAITQSLHEGDRALLRQRRRRQGRNAEGTDASQ